MRNVEVVKDRSREMDETSWWNLWNTSHRGKEVADPISNELFERAAALINGFTYAGYQRVLEVGCGTGVLSRKLERADYHGIDLSPEAIEIANRKRDLIDPRGDSASRTYEAADFHNWQLPASPFDLVTCIDAISFFRDRQLVVNKFAQSLRNGGRLLMITINRYIYDRIRRSASLRLECGPVSYWLSREELNFLVLQAGLMIDQSFTIMPRGNMGILRIINSPQVNKAFGPRVEAALKSAKERIGLGQYSVVVAHKQL
jgi:2-polyprenyl-3-methyl-5-hydroxy-6-metoxy-1,4-benzoquinol methylase